MANAEPKPRLVHTAAGALLARYIRFVGASCRQTEEMTERFEEHARHHPCIVAMWHGQFLLLPLVKHPGFEVDVMLARHRDAELMGAVLRKFGMRPHQGRGRRRAAQGPRRRARLPRRRPGPARGPHRGHDGRRAGRRGQARRARHRHDRAPVRPAGGAAGDRHLALPGARHLEPHDHQSAVVEASASRWARPCTCRARPTARSWRPAGWPSRRR